MDESDSAKKGQEEPSLRARYIVPATLLGTAIAAFLFSPAEMKMTVWQKLRSLAHTPVGGQFLGEDEPSVQTFLALYDHDFRDLSCDYGVPEAALRELVARELGREGEVGVLGLSPLKTQKIKAAVTGFAIKNNIYPPDLRRTDQPIDPALGYTNLHASLLTPEVIKAIKDTQLQGDLLSAVDKEIGSVDPKKLQLLLDNSPSFGFTVELHVNLALIATHRGPIDELVAKKHLSKETHIGLLSEVPSTLAGDMTSGVNKHRNLW